MDPRALAVGLVVLAVAVAIGLFRDDVIPRDVTDETSGSWAEAGGHSCPLGPSTAVITARSVSRSTSSRCSPKRWISSSSSTARRAAPTARAASGPSVSG